MAAHKMRKEEAFTKLPPRRMVTPSKSPYNGHVSVKSSVYSTTGCTRLATQNMVRDHLDAHYKKVNTAKSCIDNGKPKAWMNSTKKKDQLKRKTILKNGNPRASSRASSRNSYYQDEDDDDFNFKNIDFETETGHGLTASHSGRQSRYDKLEGALSPAARAGLTPRSPTPKQYSGDVLDKMSTSFIAPTRPYTPRTKKSSAESWLSKSNIYNAPQKSSRKAKRQTASPSRKRQDIVEATDSYDVEDFGRENGLNQTFEKNDPTLITALGRTESDWMSDAQQEFESDENAFYSSSIKQQHLNSQKAMHSSFRIQQEEEELLYLEFVTDVTTDVLNRGVYTNRMLKQIFESHITSNKDRLNESRMQNLVQQLQQDLAIDDDDDPEFVIPSEEVVLPSEEDVSLSQEDVLPLEEVIDD